MYNLSSAQGQRFAEIAREMTEKIRQLGPNPMKKARGQRGKGQVKPNEASVARKESHEAEQLSETLDCVPMTLAYPDLIQGVQR